MSGWPDNWASKQARNLLAIFTQMRHPAPLLTAIALLILPQLSVRGADYTITNNAGDTSAGSLDTGISAAAASGAGSSYSIGFLDGLSSILLTSVPAPVVKNSGATLTIAGPSAGETIDGNGGTIFDLSGGGNFSLSNLYLKNGANSVSGGSTLTASSLQFDNLTLAAGALSATGDVTGGNLTFSGAGGAINIGQSATVTLTGQITGSAFKVTGPGTLDLSGPSFANSTANTTIDAATVLISGQVGIGGGATLQNGGVLKATSSISSFVQFTLGAGGGVMDTNGQTVELDGAIRSTDASGSLTVKGGGTVTFNSVFANTYDGGTIIDGATVSLSNDNQIGDLPFPSFIGGITLQNGGILKTRSGITSSRAFTLGAGGGAIDTTGQTSTLSGQITGSGSLTLKGGGTVVLSKTTNSYSGGTIIDGATASVSSNAVLGNINGSITLRNGGILKTTSGIVSARGFSLGAGGGVINTNGQSSELDGQITGSGSFTLKGGGTVILGNVANSYSGGAIVDGATASISSDAMLGVGTVTLQNGGALKTTSGIVFSRAFTLGAGGGAFDTSGQTTELDGLLSGPGSLTLKGGGTAILTNLDNSYSGGTIIDGATVPISTDAVFSNGSVTLQNGGALKTTTGIAFSRGFTFGTGGGAIDTSNQTIQFNGQLTGSGGLTIKGGGTAVFAHANNYTGNTIIDASTVSIDDITEISSPIVTLQNGGVLHIVSNPNFGSNINLGTSITVGTGDGAINVDAAVNATVIGTFNGSGTLTKTGSGNLIAGGPSLPSGNIVVGAGTVTFNPSFPDRSFNGSISGPGTLAKADSSTITLFPSSLSVGNIAINAGTLAIFTLGQLTYDGPISGAGALAKLGGSNLTLTSSSLSVASLAVNSGTLTLSPTADFTYAGAITGTGALAKSGSANVTLTNSALSVGSIAVNAGTLTLGPTTDLTYGGAISGAGALATSGAKNITLTSASLAVGSIAIGGGGTVTLSPTAPLAYSGLISGSGALNVTGNSAVTLTGAATNIGGATVTSDTLQIGDGTTDGSLFGNINLVSHGTLIFNRLSTSDLVVGGSISGSGTLIKSGPGSIELDGANSMTSVVLNSGRLGIANDAALGTADLTINGGEIRAAKAGRTLNNPVTINGSFTLGRLTNFSNTVTLGGSATITSANPDNNVGFSTSTFQGSITGTGALTFTEGMSPTGQINLSGDNSYTGGTILKAGRLGVFHNHGLGSGPVEIDGGTLEVESGVKISNSVTMTGGGVYSRIMSGDITDAADSTYLGNYTTVTTLLAGSLSGSSTLLTKYSTTSAALNDSSRSSDVYSFTGTGTDPFVLQLGTHSLQNGYVLATLDGEYWTNAVNDNFGNDATADQQNFLGSFANFQSLYGTNLAGYMGAFGVDQSTGSVWAVLDHNSDYSAALASQLPIPEPKSAALLMIGGLLATRRPQRRAA